LLAAGAFAAGFLPAVRGAAQPDRAVAPEFSGIDGWLNTAAPLALAGLRGKVVLVVAAAPQLATLRVTVDGGANRVIGVERPTLYTLLDGTTYGKRVLTFEAETPGLSLVSATFG
jgi:hypothetical protein